MVHILISPLHHKLIVAILLDDDTRFPPVRCEGEVEYYLVVLLLSVDHQTPKGGAFVLVGEAQIPGSVDEGYFIAGVSLVEDSLVGFLDFAVMIKGDYREKFLY